jgi:hypothetical protein
MLRFKPLGAQRFERCDKPTPSLTNVIPNRAEGPVRNLLVLYHPSLMKPNDRAQRCPPVETQRVRSPRLLLRG